MGEERLRSLRRKIDEIDDRILGLLRKRIETSKKIGDVKRSIGVSVRDVEREKEVIKRLTKEAERAKLKNGHVKAIYREIIVACRSAQEKVVKVAFLGPRGTFTEQAGRKFFPSAGAEFLPRPTIRDVFREVETGEASFGTVPVESTTEGSVTTTLDRFLTSNLMVYGEVELQVMHDLILSPESSLDDVKVIMSHPQALAQCRDYLHEHFPDVELLETRSTAEAVRRLSKVPNAAAIGTDLAAEIYGMKVVTKGIQDNPRNYTRFFILSKKDHPRTGHDKTSVLFSVEHVPGALYRALGVFAERDVNLTKIESRPTKQKPWEYVFFLDFEGHRDGKACRETLEELKRRSTFIKVLGSYPTWRRDA